MATQKQMIAWARKEVRRSKKFRQEHEENWQRYIDLYKGKHWDIDTEDDQLIVNLVFPTVNTMIPAVAIHNPRFVVDARKPENADQARITEEVLNYLWRTYKYQPEFRLGVGDWIICGHGWIKAGWKATKPPVEKKVDTGDGVGNAEDGDEVDNIGIDDREDIEGNVESELIVDPDNDRPFIERISIFDMFIDPDARHPKEARWIAQRTWRPIADVKADDRYSATNRNKVNASSWSRYDGGDNGDGRSDDDEPDKSRSGYVEIIEFYDLKRRTVSTFAYSGDDQTEDGGYLIKPKPMPYAFGHPFIMLRNYEIPDTLYPIGDVAQIESLQLELNETRTQMLNYRKKYRRAWVYAQDRFDRDGIAALESDEDNVMIPVQGDMDPSSALAPLPSVITPPEFFDQTAMISDDIDRVSGISDYQRGAQSAIKRTATEAAMIQDAANARAQDRLAKVEDILSQVGERLVQLLQQYMTGEQVARVVTIPVNGFFSYTRDHIAGQFDYMVQGGSTEPQNETFRRQSALQIVDASIPFIQNGVVNLPMLFTELLRRGFGIKDAERFVNMPPPPPELGGPQAGAEPGVQAGGPPVPPGGPPAPGPAGPSPDQMPPEIMAAMMGGQMPPEMMGGPPGGGMPPMELTPEMLAQMKMMASQGPPMG